MFFGFQLTCGLMMVFYGYTVMKNPRVWGEQGRRAVKAEHFDEYCRQNGLFFLKAGCIMSVIAALDALFTLDAVLYVLLYLFGLAFSFYQLVKWCRENEASPGLGPASKARKSASGNSAPSRSSRSRSRKKSEPDRLNQSESHSALKKEPVAFIVSGTLS